jgi:hypothetical protein
LAALGGISLPEDLKPKEQIFGSPVEKIDYGETSQFLP